MSDLQEAIDIIKGATMEAAAYGDGKWSGHDFSAAQAEYDPSPVDDAIATILNAVVAGGLAPAALKDDAERHPAHYASGAGAAVRGR